MSYDKYSLNEIDERGEKSYERQIRPLVEDGNRGKFLVVDIESGDFEMDDDDLTASKRLIARRPQAVIHGLRIGEDFDYRIGRLIFE